MKWLFKNKMSKITPIDVRNKLIKCFININKKLIKEQAKKQGKKIYDKDIEKQLTADVKKAFELVKEDFSNPRKESFPKVIALLRRKCKLPEKGEKEIREILDKIVKVI